MNRSEFVDAVADRLGVHKADAEQYVAAVIDTIKDTVANGEKITVIGFGSFERVQRPARDARNPQTGATIKVPATNVPKFKPGDAFKRKVADEGAKARAAH